MPIYTAPTFNLTAKVWSQELSQLSTEWNFQRPTRTPDLTPACQLYVQQRGGGFGVAIPYVRTSILLSQINVRIDLRLPAGTNVRYPLPNQPDGSGMFDVVEVPANSGRLYVIIFCIDIHAGSHHRFFRSWRIRRQLNDKSIAFEDGAISSLLVNSDLYSGRAAGRVRLSAVDLANGDRIDERALDGVLGRKLSAVASRQLDHDEAVGRPEDRVEGWRV